MALVHPPSCGQPVDVLLSSSPLLQVEGDFPSTVERGGGGGLAGTVTVTSVGAAISGVTSEEAEVFVVEAGRVVCTPLPQDLVARPLVLESGAGRRLPARVSMSRCADGEPLAPGEYELYAAVTVHREDGSQVVAIGGPSHLLVL